MRQITTEKFLLTILVLATLVLSGCVIGASDITITVTTPPTLTPTQTPTETPTQTTPTVALTPTPTLTPTPLPTDGWEQRIDDLSGERYLVPPPEIEAAVREAFDAVMAVEVISDRSNEEALAYDREAAMEKMLSLAAPHVAAEYTRPDRFEIYMADLGPEHPVYCDNFERCTVGRVLAAPTLTAIVYDLEQCRGYKEWWDGAPVSDDLSRCVTGVVEEQEKRYIYGAVIELHSDGVWRVVEFDAQPLKRHYIDLTLDGIFHRPEQRIDIKMALASKNRGRVSRKFGFYSKQLNRYNV
ncbi:MAG TPA: hypothetical protein ENN19_04505 [Chloroflexi bacterium]|nr:hypothetical protein [Chloroflexota bacterium]